ncbi:MAG: alpha/beta fold hydrolase [Capsulimonadaceae bacterium]|nr:alpha/beta fold hydrolase [Capsulimonadaceae bacterium]
MPIVDMPLEQLQMYKGRNPKPADFDKFWDEALEGMHALDPAIELVPRATNARFADCFDLFYTGVGGARIHAKYLRHKDLSTPAPAVVQFHGYSGHSGEWQDKLNYVAQGYSVLSIDVRGQGGRSEDLGGFPGRTMSGHFIRGLDGGPKHMLFTHVFLDCAQLARIAMTLPGVDPARVYAQGGSQGGGLTIACAALEPRVRRLVAVHPFLSDYKRVWEMDLANGAYGELRDFFRTFDPLHEREDEIFETLGYVDVQHLAPRIKGDVLLIATLMDTTCPPSTQFAVYNKIASSKQILIYKDFGHEHATGMGDKIWEYIAA